jgi:hypothetical protein
MTFSSVIASAFLTGLTLHAVVNSPASDPLKVCITGDAEQFVVAQAEDITAHIFAGIGIHLEWYHDNRHCKTPPPEFLNVVMSSAPESQQPGVLAYSHLHNNPYIEVFYNRVLHIAEPPSVPKLLAHVLAHEIAHLLEDTGRHSDAGIMKAHWNQSDISHMAFEPMSFTAVDASLIRQGSLIRQEMLQREITAP